MVPFYPATLLIGPREGLILLGILLGMLQRLGHGTRLWDTGGILPDKVQNPGKRLHLETSS